jgi:hypothetical protein
MASKWQLSDLILNQIWLEIFEYQYHHYGWLLSAQTVIRNEQSAKKIVFFWFRKSRRKQLESDFSVKSSSLWHLFSQSLQDYIQGWLWLKEAKLDCCVLHKECHCPVQNDAELMEHAFASICHFSRVGQICLICLMSKKLQFFSGKYDMRLDFFNLRNDIIKWFAIFCSTHVEDTLTVCRVADHLSSSLYAIFFVTHM